MCTEEHLQQQYQLLSSDILIGGVTQEQSVASILADHLEQSIQVK